MARLVYGLMQSLDGYTEGTGGGNIIPAPDEELFRHFTQQLRDGAGCLYGRRIYEVMRYWDEDRPEYSEMEREFGIAWRGQPKWVASRTLKSVGPDAQVVEGDLGAFVSRLKDEVNGDIDVAGPTLAGSLTDLGLIDEYRLYLRPVVLGGGKPFFVDARPKLRLTGVDRIGEDALRLTYVP